MLNINDKPWYKLRASDVIKQLEILEDENFFFELKEDDISTNHFIKEVSAFANTYGGYIFLGVSDNKRILGCKNWNEQKIHSVMHNCITPLPNFDVKRFNIDNKQIYIVKIEEGVLPPYITNSGKICSRVSSGSFDINDTFKLNQLYHKHEEQLKIIENKLSIPPLVINDKFPNNLCAYLDFGFATTFTEQTDLERKYLQYNLQPVLDYLNKLNVKYGVSRLGDHYIFTCGEIRMDSKSIDSGLHDFLIVMPDGSAKGRIILFMDSSKKQPMANIYPLFAVTNIFKGIYSLIFNKPQFKSFIAAQKFENLTVLQQFTPFIHTDGPDNDMFNQYLRAHIKKYGENRIVCGERRPLYNFQTVDKRLLTANKIKYNYNNILTQLFPTAYVLLGYIDPIANT